MARKNLLPIDLMQLRRYEMGRGGASIPQIQRANLAREAQGYQAPEITKANYNVFTPPAMQEIESGQRLQTALNRYQIPRVRNIHQKDVLMPIRKGRADIRKSDAEISQQVRADQLERDRFGETVRQAQFNRDQTVPGREHELEKIRATGEGQIGVAEATSQGQVGAARQNVLGILAGEGIYPPALQETGGQAPAVTSPRAQARQIQDANALADNLMTITGLSEIIANPDALSGNISTGWSENDALTAMQSIDRAINSPAFQESDSSVKEIIVMRLLNSLGVGLDDASSFSGWEKMGTPINRWGEMQSNTSVAQELIDSLKQMLVDIRTQ